MAGARLAWGGGVVVLGAAVAAIIASTGSNGCRPYPAFPNLGCTGVPAGTTLTAHAGNIVTTADGQVITGMRLTGGGCFVVQHTGVTIENSDAACVVMEGTRPVDPANPPLTVRDSQFDCADVAGGTAINYANFVALRVDVHSCENGFSVSNDVVIEDSYCHDMYNSGEAHTDCIQFSNRGASGEIPGAANITIRHNTFYGMGDDGTFGTSAIISAPTGDTNILVEKNLMAGGAFTLYCDRPGAGTNYRVIDNHFSTVFGPHVGSFGPQSDCGDESLSGNVIHETGLPVPGLG